MIHLAAAKPFAQGGNRLCFVHPEDAGRCVKVRRPDFTLEDRRRRKGFPKNLRPLSSFDDNLEEQRVLDSFVARFGDEIFQHVSRCYGFIETDLGRGLCSELIRDGNKQISKSLKQFIWDNDITDDLRASVEMLIDFWCRLCVPSRELLLHNIVVQVDSEGQVVRLVVIDGLGSSGFVPWKLIPTSMKHSKVQRKTQNLRDRIEKLRLLRGEGAFPGRLGVLMDDGLDSAKG